LFSRIIVGVDDSQPSKDAVVLAARLAREHDGRLILYHSVNCRLPVARLESTGAMVDPAPIVPGLVQQGKALLIEGAQIAKRFGIEAEQRMVEGEPAECLVQLAGEVQCRLVVMGTHGRHGLERLWLGSNGLERLWLGSTTEAVLRLSTIPVLTVRPGERIADLTRRCFERIIVGIDDSEPSDAATRTVLKLPAEDRRQVLFYGIADETLVGGWAPYSAGLIDALHKEAQQVVDKALALARADDVSAEGRVVDGMPSDALIAAAQERRADLIVLGSHGRRGVQRFFLGSVAESVVRTGPVPVLVVRTAAA
jgi:nucleotide-binding universal stress UspA family protein